MSTGNSGGSCSEGWKAVWFYGTEEQPRTRLSSCYGHHSSRFSIVSIHPMLHCLYCETSWSAAGTRKSLNPVVEKQESQTELILIFVHFSQYLLHNPFGGKEVQGGIGSVPDRKGSAARVLPALSFSPQGAANAPDLLWELESSILITVT